MLCCGLVVNHSKTVKPTNIKTGTRKLFIISPCFPRERQERPLPRIPAQAGILFMNKRFLLSQETLIIIFENIKVKVT